MTSYDQEPLDLHDLKDADLRDLNMATEKLMLRPYARQHNVYKKSHVMKRYSDYHTLDLPKNSVIHVCDFLKEDTQNLIPDFEVIYPIKNEEYVRAVYNVFELPRDKPYKSSDKYRYRTNGVAAAFAEFFRQRGKVFKRVLKLDGALKRTNLLTILNYNAYNRIIVTGSFSEYRRFDIVLRGILSKVAEIAKSHPEKNQYVSIDLNDTPYPYAHFRRIKKSGFTRSSVKVLGDNTFYMMANLVNLVNTGADSLFKLIPRKLLSSINLIVNVGDKATVLNLDELMKLAEIKMFDRKLVAHLNLLKLSAHLSPEEFQAILDSTSESEILDKIDKKATELTRQEETSALSGTAVSPILAKAQDSGLPDPDKVRRVEGNTKTTTSFEEEYLAMVDRKIDNDPELTDKQKEKAKVASRAYQQIYLHTATMGELLADTSSPGVGSAELDFLEDRLIDKSLTKSSMAGLNEAYITQMDEKDFARVLVSLGQAGMYIVDYDVEEVVNELDRYRLHTFKFVDKRGKTHTMNRIKLPILSKEGTFLINGIENKMTKQMINKPICKIDADKVSLASNYIKTLVIRNTANANSFAIFIQKYIRSLLKGHASFKVAYDKCTPNYPVPYEYGCICAKFKSLRFKTFVFLFNPEERADIIAPGDKKLLTQDKLKELEQQYGFICGKNSVKPKEYYFFGMDNRIRLLDIRTSEIVEDTNIVNILRDAYPTNIMAKRYIPAELTELKILDKNLPIGFVLAYQFGFSNLLKMLNVKYRFVEAGKSTNMSTSEVRIIFSDGSLVFSRYPQMQSLLLSGFTKFTSATKTILFREGEMDNKDTYATMLESKGWSTNYLKGITSFFDLFVDANCRDNLVRMHEPTTVRELLIRATEMLLHRYCIEPASMMNHRIRGYERFNTILYNSLARELAAHNHKLKVTRARYSIPPDEVFLRILQDQTTSAVESINPVQDIKDDLTVTYTGFGGRSAQSFVARDRRFPQDGTGTLSECTPDSGKVAITAYTTVDPCIADIRGMLDPDTVDPASAGAAEVVSVTSCLMPCATNDD